jgi:hypothetical protein
VNFNVLHETKKKDYTDLEKTNVAQKRIYRICKHSAAGNIYAVIIVFTKNLLISKKSTKIGKKKSENRGKMLIVA